MAEPSSNEPALRPFLPGAAEIFAIRYRTQWRSLGLTPPDELRHDALRLQPPMPLETAALNIRKHLQSLRSHDILPDGFKGRLSHPSMYALNLARLAMADLARAEGLSGAPDVARDLLEVLAETMEVHEDFRAIQQTYQNMYTIDVEREEEDGERLPRFEARHFLRLVRSVEQTADVRFFRAFTAPELRLLNGQRSAPPRLRNFVSKRSYDKFVAGAEVSVEVDRPSAAFAPLIDPRAWSRNVPTVWPGVTSVLTAEPQDRSQTGTIDGDQTRLHEADAPFFEEAVFGVGVCPLSRHRNLLRVTLNFAVPDKLEFTYRQASCLTADIIGNPTQAGGIDVDTGFGSCKAIAGAPEPWCELRAKKKLRFTLPADPVQNKMYNDINAVALPLLIESFVLFGAMN